MKKFFLFLFTAAFVLACNDKKAGSPKNTDLIQQNLKGKVQQYDETTYNVDSTGKTGQADSVIAVTEFDEKGYTSKFIRKDNTGKLKEDQTFTRYDNGALKELSTKADGKQTFRLTTDLDKDGKYITATTYDSTGKMDSYYKNITENEYGEVLTATQYKIDSTLKSSFTSNFQEANYTGGVSKDSAGKETFRSTIKLNEKGDPAEETTVNVMKDTTKTETVSYKYDSYDKNGNWTQRTTYNDKGKPVKIVKRTIIYFKD